MGSTLRLRFLFKFNSTTRDDIAQNALESILERWLQYAIAVLTFVASYYLILNNA